MEMCARVFVIFRIQDEPPCGLNLTCGRVTDESVELTAVGFGQRILYPDDSGGVSYRGCVPDRIGVWNDRPGIGWGSSRFLRRRQQNLRNDTPRRKRKGSTVDCPIFEWH